MGASKATPDADGLTDYDRMSDGDLLERCRAARALIDASHGENAEVLNLMGFMALVERKPITATQARRMLGIRQ